MLPGEFSLSLYRGDTYYGPLMVLPNLTAFGGPANLSAATVRAQLRQQARDTSGVDMIVEIVDPVARSLRLTLPAADTALLPRSGVWDLQVTSGAWVGTVLAGPFTVLREVTR